MLLNAKLLQSKFLQFIFPINFYHNVFSAELL